jgi:F-type H+-transporting ATPase subunit a
VTVPSAVQAMAPASGDLNCHFESLPRCGFPAPDTGLFEWPGIGGTVIDKPIVLAVFCAALVVIFFWAATANSRLVPGRMQSVGELGYLFVRDQVSRSIIGKKGDKYVPFLVSLFFFVWFMNLMSIIPLAQFPVTSRIAFPAGLAIMVWLVYMGVGFKRHGFVGYLRVLCWPSGVPAGVMVILVPIEFLSNVLVRPFTLAIRLFANMFAGHLLIATFSIAAWYLLSPNVVGLLASATSLVMAVVMTAFELLIQALQAFIFVALTASYINGALEEAH